MFNNREGITYSMEQSPSWEADWFSASQEFPRILWNLKVHYRFHTWPPPVSILRQSISPGPRFSVWTFRNMICFYGEELLANRPTPKLEDHLVSVIRDCLFTIFAATLYTGGRSSIRNLRPRPVMVTGNHLLRTEKEYFIKSKTVTRHKRTWDNTIKLS